MDKINGLKLVGEFKQDLIERGLSPDTLKSYPGPVVSLCKFNQGDLLGVDQGVLSKYLSNLRSIGLKRISLDKQFTILSTFYKFLMFKGYIAVNPVPAVREHYLREAKGHDTSQRRQFISVNQAAALVKSIHDTRDKAIVILLFKTGIRRKELAELDLKDVDMETMTINLKPTAKRTNEIVYFDSEAQYILSKWLKRRAIINSKGLKALFIDRYGNRLSVGAVNLLFEKYAEAIGLHDPDSDRLQDKLTPHCCRHWFSTVLVEAGMPRHYVQELRGDVGREAIDIYTHIDKNKLRAAYLEHIPKLGVV